ncbi:DUF935 domain-containing protein [Azonexus sp. R2A61]|uniref:DUF935 domain-containing protein n=1 Tax=Azonexus sp. R2A61 TaxID=2744443 RepID=UPI001F2FC201|nr:DUF935 domain-containing protein [Azonexus sp. R2A61]
MPKILDQFGRPIARDVLDAPQTSRIASLADTRLSAMLDGLTPSRLAAYLRDADNGDLTAQHRVFADMEERDAHLASELGKRKQAPLNLDWDIVPPRNATAEEKKHADWAKEVLTDAVDPVEDLILALQDGVGHGFAAVELEWRREGSELLPAFLPRPQEWFQLNTTRTDLRLKDMSMDGAPLAPFGWICHTLGKAKTGYLGRMGLHRVLVWPFIYKAYSIGDFAEFLETYGLPIIVGKYYSGALDEEKDSLLRAVTALGHDARAIMPKDMELEIQKITGGGEGSHHLAMVDWAERSESKAILGQTTSAEAKATGLGSGIADAHKEVRKDIRNSDARQAAATITRDLIYPMIALNRGNIDGLRRCPRMVFDTGEPEDMKAFAESLPKLVGVGFKIPRDWGQEKLRIPVPRDGEEVLAVPPADRTVPPVERPAPAKAEAALAALSAQDDTPPEFPDQVAVDDALDAIPAEALQAQMEQIIGPILKDLETAGGYEEAMAALAGRYPALDAAKLEGLLARAMFVAELWGAASAE